MVQLTGGLQVCTLMKEEEISKNAKGIYLVLIIGIDERLACLEWVYRHTLPIGKQPIQIVHRSRVQIYLPLLRQASSG